MTTTAGLRPYHRMPVEFGAAPGPRNIPDDAELPFGPERRTSVAFTVAVLAADVEPLLPPGLTLQRPAVTVRVQQLTNLRWLGGRGYDIVSVSLPVVWQAGTTARDGEFLAVLWENMAEPIVTGREELGFPKLFANIVTPGFTPGDTEFSAHAAWDDIPFFTSSARELAPSAAAPEPPRPIITHRYLPALGRLHDAEVDQLTVSSPPTTPAPVLVHCANGMGRVAFHPVSWQENPLQWQVINTLADIIQTDAATVQVTCAEGDFSAVRNERLG